MVDVHAQLDVAVLSGVAADVRRAELRWVEAILAGLRDGSLKWSREELLAIAAHWKT